MKLITHRLFQRLLSNKALSHKGYTIDQTILIVAIIAILITLIIVTVGWQLINRTSGTKAAAQLRQVEDANGQFFSSQRVWPHQAFSSAASATAANNMRVLVDPTGTGAPALATNIKTTELRNLLPGFAVASGVVTHGFGSGNGVVIQQANSYPVAANIGTDQRMVVQFSLVPLSEAEESDEAIDGALNATTGRVVYRATGNCLNGTAGGAAPGGATVAAGTSTVTLCYAANTVK